MKTEKYLTTDTNITLKAAISALLMAGSVVAMAAQDITAKEAEQINAELAPVVNPEANAEKVGSVPEDPAAVVGTRFTYQGTLRLNGDRANGTFDLRFKLFDQLTGGVQLGPGQLRPDKVVTDGLFDTELDFGQTPIDGDDLFLQIEVRDGASTGAYTVLSPRQRINATPYAVRALTGGDGAVSPWAVNGADINYTGGNVGIGTAAPAAPLHVKSSNEIPVKVDGGPRVHMNFYEQGVYRGYLGSYQTATGTTDADFEIGTGGGSTGKMHIVTQATPRITVLADGKVGIGTKTPTAFTHIKAPAGVNPLSVRTDDGVNRLSVKSDGSTKFEGDVTQQEQYGGILKAMVYIESCGAVTPAPVAIIRQYNGVNSMAITAEGTAAGKCEITFPFGVNTRYWNVSAFNTAGNNDRVSALCDVASGGTLSCVRFEIGTVNVTNKTGPIMVAVY